MKITICATATLALILSACGGANEASSEKTQKPKDEAADKADGKAAEPGGDAPSDPAAGPPEGYDAYLVSALAELGGGAAIARAETKAYGCSVKYADEGGEPTAKIGEAAPTFRLPNLAGEQVSLADFAGKTVVLEWFNPDCPFVKYAHGEGGPLASLASEQTQTGIVWLAINSGAPGKQGAGVERNQQAKADWKLDHPILIDEDGQVGHAYGAKTTPHMFVIDPEGKLVYAGGLDNAPLGRVDG